MNAHQQLAALIDTFTPEIATTTRRLLARLAERTPGATALVYDNFNTLTIAFSPSERAAETICMLAVYPRWINLCFLQGARLPDPHRRLFGNGRLARNVRLASVDDLDEPVVSALLDAALQSAAVPLDPARPPRLIIKSIGKQRRARRQD